MFVYISVMVGWAQYGIMFLPVECLVRTLHGAGSMHLIMTLCNVLYIHMTEGIEHIYLWIWDWTGTVTVRAAPGQNCTCLLKHSSPWWEHLLLK